ncbi:unnamed protein product [Paramecium pentaurelia]|uniref:Transmembrane protein n=1 Tax=Paramecium pentaurelia TaxID=43138 RepID=A0A8S1VXS6_9CILI|nr:unnamed protein product [Paramecium pentaurelia]
MASSIDNFIDKSHFQFVLLIIENNVFILIFVVEICLWRFQEMTLYPTKGEYFEYPINLLLKKNVIYNDYEQLIYHQNLLYQMFKQQMLLMKQQIQTDMNLYQYHLIKLILQQQPKKMMQDYTNGKTQIFNSMDKQLRLKKNINAIISFFFRIQISFLIVMLKNIFIYYNQ